MDWRGLSPDELERHYNPRVAVPDFERHIETVRKMSAAARERLASRLDIRYGEGPLETLDVFPANRPQAPIHVYIHGGYWRLLDKSDYSVVAEPLVAAGATVVTLNYDLCPAVTLDDVVAETLRGITWVARNAADLGGDAGRIYLSGHSAGAHLAAMAIGHDWTAEALPADLVKGAVLVSGIYDPQPVLGISANQDIRLTREMARRNNACKRPPRGGGEVLVAVGGDETEGWIAQSRAYHRAAGVRTDLLVVPERHHFSVSYDMVDAERPLCRAMLAQMGLGR
ncbi:MAG: alpha/beta hydrolase [Alphaproteobacteria bacterium]